MHSFCIRQLSLPLFMLGVNAYNPHHASSLNDFAFGANFFDGRFYFHPALPSYII